MPARQPQQQDYLAVLGELIAFPTVSADSNLALIDYAEALLDAHGFSTERTYNDDRSKANLVARIGPDVAGGLALSGHTDVVPVSGQDWNSDPFELVQKGDALYGRGTSDMKGFIALALAAAVRVDEARLEKPLHLILTYDEEVGCLGAAALQEKLEKMARKPRFVLIGEPTDMQLVTAHKGIQNMATRVRGKPGHSSQPAAGASSIAGAARFVTAIGQALPAEPDADFDPPTATCNIGLIRGGEAVNIIPEWCDLRWEFRHLPQQDPREIHAAIDKLTRTLCEDMPGVAFESRVVAGVPGLLPDTNREIVRSLRQYLAPREPLVTAVPFVTEGGLFQQAGIPAVVCGPGRLDQAHQPNEMVSMRSMEAYRDFLARVIASATTGREGRARRPEEQS